MIVVLSKKATPEDVKKASEEYKNYIKITIDLKKEIVAIGGEYHYDAEQILLKQSCQQENIWGGGIDLINKKIETNAIINIRPKQNNSTEILNQETRNKFIKLVKKYLIDHDK